MKIYYFYIIALSFMLASCSAVGIRNYEEPKYQALVQEDNFEIRLYSDVLVAQSTSSGTYKESSGSNFDRLAGYIFGKNKINKKIDMTSPVLQKKESEKMDMTVPVYQQQENADWTMTFVLPSQYSIDTVPIPLDEDVIVKVLPKIKVATLRFNGSLNEDSIQKNTQKLENWVKQKNFNVVSSPYSAAYDPPWTLPMLRRNEIHIPIE